MKIPIKKATVWKTGSSAVITIPSYLIETHQINIGQEYDLEIEATQ